MSRKRFIDKEKSVTFHLLHRSQRDPLAADETAPQRVLAEVDDSKGDAKLSDREIQRKYGVYFDDDYNYLQHIKQAKKQDVVWIESAASAKRKRRAGAAPAVSEAAAGTSAGASGGQSLQLPSSVFASHVEEKVGLLNKAAPNYGPPDALESQLAEVMDDDFTPGPEDELEDNFFELAGGVATDSEGEEEIEVDASDDEYVDSDQFDEEGVYDSVSRPRAKSQFTEYSTTSQGVLSTVAMEALNERFENFMGQYEDLEVGGLDTEEISGTLDPNSDQLMQLVEEYEKAKQKPTIEKEMALRKYEEEEDKDDTVCITVYENVKEDRMDCESILSTYSNTRNCPKVIDAPNNNSKIKIDKKGIAKDDRPKLTKKALAQLDAGSADDSDNSDTGSESSFGHETLASRISMLSVRHQGETPEERKARKHELKALRRERIQERKANQELANLLSQRQGQSQMDKLKAKQSIRYQ